MITCISLKIREIEGDSQQVHNTKKRVSHHVEVKKKLRNEMEAKEMSSNGNNACGHHKCKISNMQVLEAL